MTVNQKSGTALGAACAIAAGATVYMMTGRKMRSRRKLRKSAAKAVRMAQELAGDVSRMMR